MLYLMFDLVDGESRRVVQKLDHTYATRFAATVEQEEFDQT